MKASPAPGGSQSRSDTVGTSSTVRLGPRRGHTSLSPQASSASSPVIAGGSGCGFLVQKTGLEVLQTIELQVCALEPEPKDLAPPQRPLPGRLVFPNASPSPTPNPPTPTLWLCHSRAASSAPYPSKNPLISAFWRICAFEAILVVGKMLLHLGSCTLNFHVIR